MFSSNATADKRETVTDPAGAREDSSSKKAKLDTSCTSGTATAAKPASSPAANDDEQPVSTHKERRGSGTGLIRTLSSSMRNLSSDSLAYVDNFMRRNISKPSFAKKKTRRGRRRATSKPSSATLATGTSADNEDPEPMDDDNDEMVMEEEFIYVDTSDLNGSQQQGRLDLDEQASGIFF